MSDQLNIFDDAGRDTPGMAQRQGQGETSALAAKRIAPDTGKLRLRVLRTIYYSGGCTDEEGISRTDLPASTYRPRRVELHKGWRDVDGGYIEDSGERKATVAGRAAIIWRVTAKWREAIVTGRP